MVYFEITDFDWIQFENEFTDITRSEVIEVSNFYRHQCRIFILKTMLEQWNNDDQTVSYYRVTKQDNVCKWFNENLS
jgi:hypothetical protein